MMAIATIDKYAYDATAWELAGNSLNLIVPRYVNTFEEEDEIALEVVQRGIPKLEAKLSQVRTRMRAYLEELKV